MHKQENFLPLFEALNLARIEKQYHKPIFIKLSPDEDEQIITGIIEAIKKFEFDGVITSNTTIEKDNLRYSGRTISKEVCQANPCWRNQMSF